MPTIFQIRNRVQRRPQASGIYFRSPAKDFEDCIMHVIDQGLISRAIHVEGSFIRCTTCIFSHLSIMVNECQNCTFSWSFECTAKPL